MLSQFLGGFSANFCRHHKMSRSQTVKLLETAPENKDEREIYTEGWSDIWLESDSSSGGCTQMVQLLSSGQTVQTQVVCLLSQRERKTLCTQMDNLFNIGMLHLNFFLCIEQRTTACCCHLIRK